MKSIFQQQGLKQALKWASLIGAASLFCGVFIRAESYEQVPYPEGYRNWTHVKSAIIGPDNPDAATSGGMRHLYANDKAMDGFRAGRYSDGSILVFDLLRAETKEGVTTGGRRRYIAVMHKDGKRFAKTGGWGFEVFLRDSRTERTVGPDAKTKCFDCHASQPDKDFVFGSFRK